MVSAEMTAPILNFSNEIPVNASQRHSSSCCSFFPSDILACVVAVVVPECVVEAGSMNPSQTLVVLSRPSLRLPSLSS